MASGSASHAAVDALDVGEEEGDGALGHHGPARQQVGHGRSSHAGSQRPRFALHARIMVTNVRHRRSRNLPHAGEIAQTRARGMRWCEAVTPRPATPRFAATSVQVSGGPAKGKDPSISATAIADTTPPLHLRVPGPHCTIVRSAGVLERDPCNRSASAVVLLSRAASGMGLAWPTRNCPQRCPSTGLRRSRRLCTWGGPLGMRLAPRRCRINATPRAPRRVRKPGAADEPRSVYGRCPPARSARCDVGPHIGSFARPMRFRAASRDPLYGTPVIGAELREAIDEVSVQPRRAARPPSPMCATTTSAARAACPAGPWAMCSATSRRPPLTASSVVWGGGPRRGRRSVLGRTGPAGRQRSTLLRSDQRPSCAPTFSPPRRPWKPPSRQMPDAAWLNLTRGVDWDETTADHVVFSRWRDVEVHHVALGLGYDPTHWPPPLVDLWRPTVMAELVRPGVARSPSGVGARPRAERPTFSRGAHRPRCRSRTHRDLARGGGLEPPMTGPEPAVLPITPPPKVGPTPYRTACGGRTPRLVSR